MLPLPTLVTSDYSYWLVCSRQTAQMDHMRIFMDWLAEEVDRQPDMADYISIANRLFYGIGVARVRDQPVESPGRTYSAEQMECI